MTTSISYLTQGYNFLVNFFVKVSNNLTVPRTFDIDTQSSSSSTRESDDFSANTPETQSPIRRSSFCQSFERRNSTSIGTDWISNCDSILALEALATENREDQETIKSNASQLMEYINKRLERQEQKCKCMSDEEERMYFNAFNSLFIFFPCQVSSKVNLLFDN